jgi:hypothetical protein
MRKLIMWNVMTLDGYFPIIIITWPYHYGQEKANKEKNDKNLTQKQKRTHDLT